MTEREALVEEAAGAWRPRGFDAVRPHPAWADLDPEGRLEVYQLTRVLRRLEAALDPRGSRPRLARSWRASAVEPPPGRAATNR